MQLILGEARDDAERLGQPGELDRATDRPVADHAEPARAFGQTPLDGEQGMQAEASR